MSHAADTLYKAVVNCIEDQLGSDDAVLPGEVTEMVMELFPELVEERATDLIKRCITRWVKDIMRAQTTEDDEQYPIPGLVLPTAIAIPTSTGDIRYLRTDKARWQDLEAGLKMRNINIARANAKLRRYVESMDRLRPIMQGKPRMTVAQAIRKLAA